jgi:hypothetical protein
MYRARWLGPDGRERSRTFTRKAEAVRHLAAVEGASCHAHTSATRIRVTVGEYARQLGRDGSPPADHGNASRLSDQQAR